MGPEAAQVLDSCLSEAEGLGQPYVHPEHILLALLKYDSQIADLLAQFGVTYDALKDAAASKHSAE